MQILIIAEHDNQTLKRATYHAVSAAQQLSKQITVLIIGYQCQSVVEAARRLPVQQILVADDAVYEYQLAENSAALIVEQAKSYAYVITAATTFGKNILPRVAALLNVDMLSDVMQVIAPNQFVRPMYAGNVLATVQLDESIKLLTIRTTA
ncbi:MAG TPA: electron transfer flavoprotein subunit alpha/FixB family protein, partial [Gammaproteobacteria bacterium]|nr:electron transfer flavoprotein subunit alpha/FixB family protein [Gammaproteobacteria bacterium]